MKNPLNRRLSEGIVRLWIVEFKKGCSVGSMPIRPLWSTKFGELSVYLTRKDALLATFRFKDLVVVKPFYASTRSPLTSQRGILSMQKMSKFIKITA